MAKVHIELTHSKWAMTPFTAEDHQVSILLLASTLISANDSNPIQFCQAITQSRLVTGQATYCDELGRIIKAR